MRPRIHGRIWFSRQLLSVGWPAAYYPHQGPFQQIREFPAKSASSCLGLWSPKGAPQQITRTPTKKCTRPVFTSALKWCEEFPISCTRDGVSPEHCFQWVPSMHSFVAGPPCDTSVSSKNRRDRCPAPPITHPRERILGGACDSALPP